MYKFTRDDVNLEAIRERIAKMSDEELQRYGEAAAVCDGPEGRSAKPPVLQN